MGEVSTQSSLDTSPECQIGVYISAARDTGKKREKGGIRKERNGWMSKEEWVKSRNERNRVGKQGLASESPAQTPALRPPQGPGLCPGPTKAIPPLQCLGVPQEGTTQEATAHYVPTERGLASAIQNTNGLKPLSDRKNNNDMSNLEGGGHGQNHRIPPRHHQ